MAVSTDLIRQYEKAYLAKDKPAAAKLDAEAEVTLKQVKDEYGDVSTGNNTASKLADKYIDQLRYRSLGKVAAETIGEDLDGQKFKLSDYRGKVVVFYFWATWCTPCVYRIPHEKSLYARMDKNKFAMIGVDSDFKLDRAQVKKYVENKGMAWRQIWDDGSVQGTVARQWGVRSWPTTYVLDHKGVIRFRDVHQKELDHAVDELIREWDADNAKSGKQSRLGEFRARCGAFHDAKLEQTVHSALKVNILAVDRHCTGRRHSHLFSFHGFPFITNAAEPQQLVIDEAENKKCRMSK